MTGKYPCGWCGQGKPGACGDKAGRCKGTWADAVPVTKDNPLRQWSCPCSIAGHPGRAS
jgi:hypothetical protein